MFNTFIVILTINDTYCGIPTTILIGKGTNVILSRYIPGIVLLTCRLIFAFFNCLKISVRLAFPVPLLIKRTKVMDDLYTLQNLVSSELSKETSLFIRIAAVFTLLVKMEVKRLGRFYRMKLGING